MPVVEKGSGLLKGIENITKILNGVTAAANAYNSATMLIGIIMGKDGGLAKIERALDAIAGEMQEGFDRVVNAINLSTLTQQWQPLSSELREIQRTSHEITMQFGTLKGEQPENWTIDAFGRRVPFHTWCESGVPGSDQKAALTTLAVRISKLGTLVGTGISTIDPSMIDVWDRITAAAAAADVEGFKGRTRYEMMYRLMEAIFATLGALVYVHETVLALYYAQNPSNPGDFISVAEMVRHSFGDVDTPGSLWAMFDARMKSYVQSNPDPTKFAPAQEYGLAATTGDSGGDKGGAVDIKFFAGKQMQKGEFCYVWPLEYELGESNAFFARLQWRVLRTIQPFGNNRSTTCQVAYLAGVPVTVGENLSTTVGDFAPTLSGSENKFKDFLYWALADSDNAKNLNFPNIKHAFPFINTSYSKAPKLADDNLLPVITGFRIVVKGNRFVLSLKYKQLDVSDPDNPTVKAIPDVDWIDNTATFKDDPNYFALNGWAWWQTKINQMDERPAGSSEYFPMTNASFCQTGPTPSGGRRLGLIAQSAWPIHRASFFQPAGTLTAKPVPLPPGAPRRIARD